jgi:ATP-grasp domain
MHLYLLGKAARIALPMMQAAQALKADGYLPCTLIGDLETAPLRQSAHCDGHLLVDFERPDDDRFCRLIHALAEKNPDAVLMPYDCDGIRLASRLRHRLRMRCSPIPDLETLDMLDDKWRFHGFCARNALSVPPSCRLTSKRSLGFAALTAQFGLPFVLKPITGSGSVGVRIIRSETQFNRDILNNPDYDFAPLIAQQFIDGEDIDLSLQATNGRLTALAIQQSRGRQVRFVRNAYLEGVAGQICEASLFHGVMHIDARVERGTGRVFLIECNPRFWASHTAAAACGLNFISASLRRAEPREGVHSLTEGTCNTRHPLLQPSAWLKLALDRQVAGRLLRIRLFDFYTLRELFGEMAARLAAPPAGGASAHPAAVRAAPALRALPTLPALPALRKLPVLPRPEVRITGFGPPTVY